MVGDGIFSCNVPIGFIDVLTFRRFVKRCQLSDFFFFTKMGEFQEQDSLICFNFKYVLISFLVASSFSFVRGHCSVQTGLSPFQVILIIALFVK